MSLKGVGSRIEIPKVELKTVLTRNSDGGATLTYFTQSVTVLPVQKHEIKVTPDYKVTSEHTFITP